MASSEPRYVCQECGHEAHKWMGKCTGCGAWNTLVKETESADVEAQVPDLSTDGQNGTAAAQNQPTQLTEVEMEGESRLKTGVDELDRVMGGGIMQGSFSLIAGDPGIGKSTLMTELGGYLPGRKILYVTGEESKRQVKLRAQRLGVDSDALYLLAETNVQEIANAVDDV
ncbi:DNA repair protein RadA, partial [Salinibacter ruber]